VQRVARIQDTDKGGNPVDRSIVMVEDSASREKLTLVKDMPARTSASYAVLTSPDGSATMKVKQGDTFKWPGDDTASYTVIDLREDQVVLQQVETRKMWTVTRGAAQ
jgi:transcription elongation GreA/GreB family factor